MINIGNLRRIVYALRGEKTEHAFEEIKELDSANTKLITEYKESKINELFNFLKINNVYYRALILDNINSYVDAPIPLDAFPFVTKKEIKENYRNLLVQGLRGYLRSTSGTTGEPLVFMKDCNASAYMDAMMYHVYSWHGISPTDRQARLWGSSVDIKGQLTQAAKDYLLDRRRLSAFKMNDNKCIRYYHLLLKFRPKYFYSYPSTLYNFAQVIEKQGFSGKKLGIPIAICTGEVLFAHHKEKIQQFFGCKVVSEYGSSENGIIGFECEHGKMHVLPTIHLEIVDPDNEGYGSIAVTELNSRSLPFVRYLNGDVGRLVKGICSCQRPYKLLEIRDGRENDYIRCTNGSIVRDAILAYTLKRYVNQFKGYQKVLNAIEIDYLNNEELSSNLKDKLNRKLQAYLGEDMEILFNRVDQILPEKSGKLRYFVPMSLEKN